MDASQKSGVFKSEKLWYNDRCLMETDCDSGTTTIHAAQVDDWELAAITAYVLKKLTRATVDNSPAGKLTDDDVEKVIDSLAFIAEIPF